MMSIYQHDSNVPRAQIIFHVWWSSLQSEFSYHSGRSNCVVNLLRLDSYTCVAMHIHKPLYDIPGWLAWHGLWFLHAAELRLPWPDSGLPTAVEHMALHNEVSSSSRNMKRTERKQKRGPLDQFLVTVKKDHKTVIPAWAWYCSLWISIPLMY